MPAFIDPQLRFLIVEDSSFFRSAVNSMLLSLGIHEIELAQNGNQAIESCKSRHFDVILCDFDLGKGKSGQQVLEALRHFELIDKNTLFMMLTADTSRQAVLATSEYAADDYLTKPINATVLQRRLARLLNMHKAFKPAIRALENNDTEHAIALLEKFCRPQQRLANHAKKLLGDVLLQANLLDRAETHFQAAIAEKPLEWAHLGLANTYASQGLHGRAQEVFNNILKENPLCLAAYDGLASIYHAQQEYGLLQQAINNAVKASPMSILRQKNLANIAEENGDIETAITALRECVRLGIHSCYGEWEDAYRLGMNTADAPKMLLEKKEMLPQEALKALKLATNYFDVSNDDLLRIQFLQGRLQYLSRQHFDGQQSIYKAENHYQTRDQADIQTDIARIKAIRTLHEEKRAKALTDELAEHYADDEQALVQLDKVLDEPLSKTNKRLLAKANKEGIELYNQQMYDEAVLCFQRAQVLFPRHLGLQMNICQAYIGKHNRGDAGDLDALINEQLKSIREQLSPQDPQFERYRKLLNMAQL